MLDRQGVRPGDRVVQIQGNPGRFLRVLTLTGSATAALLLCSSVATAQGLPPRPDAVFADPGLCKHTLGEIAEALSDGVSLGEGTILGVAELGAFDQIFATSDPPGGCAAGSFPTAGAHYLALSTGRARESLVQNTNASYGNCQWDPDYGGLCDVAAVDLTISLSPGASLLSFDYRYFSWDHNPDGPYDDPFRVSIIPPLSPPVTVFDTDLTCEFYTKGVGLQCGDSKEVKVDVSPWAGSTITVRFEVSDRFDTVRDAGVLLDDLQVSGNFGGSGGGEVFPSCAGPCDDLEGCGYGYGNASSLASSFAGGDGSGGGGGFGSGGYGGGCSTYGFGDGVCDQFDNCPFDINPDQADCDGDGIGDACEVDSDFDGRGDDCDNCPFEYNYDQKDCNEDGTGDLCDFVSTCNAPIIDSFTTRKEVVASQTPYYALVGEGLVEIELTGHTLLDDINVTLQGPSGTLYGTLVFAAENGHSARVVFDMNGVQVGAYTLNVERFGQNVAAAQRVEVWPSVPNVRGNLQVGPPSPGRSFTNHWHLTNIGTRDAVVVMALSHPAQFMGQFVSTNPGTFFGTKDHESLYQQDRLQVVAVFVPNNEARTLQSGYYWPSANFAFELEQFCVGKPATCKAESAWDPQYGVITGQKLPLGWPVQFDDVIVATLTVDEWEGVKLLPTDQLLEQAYETDRARQLASAQEVPLILPDISAEDAEALAETEAIITQTPYSVFKTTVARRLALP